MKACVQTIINYEKRGILTPHRIEGNLRYKRAEVVNAPIEIKKRKVA